ncbi:hypothetical protein ACOSQ2_013144 [Xanthoceras sorbifolium]
MQKEKRKHKFSFELAKKLIEKDTTWLCIEDQATELVEGPKEQTKAEEHEDTWEDHDHAAVANRSTSSSSFAMGTSRQVPSPLLLAAAVGITEIVKEMIRYCPQVFVKHKLNRALISSVAVPSAAGHHNNKLNRAFIGLAILERAGAGTVTQ